jgi:hypothetical protein
MSKGFASGGGFGAAAGGFGKAPAGGGFGGKAPAVGFGNAAGAGTGTGGAGFGAAAGGGGFGAKQPAAGGFGTSGGFGAPAGGGFGKTGGGGGFGTAGGGQAGPALGVNPYARPAGAAGAAVVGQYLLQWDNVYNADHPDCKFREFFYNMCTPGHSEQAVQRERQGPLLRGSAGCREEQWIVARRDNPDPENMYPAPVHFQVGLKARAAKQKEQVAEYHKHVNALLKSLAELRALQDENDDRYRRLLLEESMIEGRLLIAMARAEVLRQGGLKIGQERHAVGQRTDALRGRLAAASVALGELESLAVEGAETAADDAASAIAAAATPVTIKDWSRFVEANEGGIRKLQRVLREDMQVVRAILQRVEAAP